MQFSKIKCQTYTVKKDLVRGKEKLTEESKSMSLMKMKEMRGGCDCESVCVCLKR